MYVYYIYISMIIQYVSICNLCGMICNLLWSQSIGWGKGYPMNSTSPWLADASSSSSPSPVSAMTSKKKQFGGRFRPLFTVNIEDKMELFGEMTQWKESKMYQQKMQKVLRTGQKWMNCLGRRLTLWFYRMVICKRVTNYMRTMV